MKAIVYVVDGNRQCRIVRDTFNKHNVKYVLKNITTNGITEVEIKYLLERTNIGFEDLLAPRSHAYKRIADTIEDMSTKELVDYIIANPTIIRTPIIYTKRDMQVGYDETQFKELLESLLKGKGNVSD